MMKRFSMVGAVMAAAVLVGGSVPAIAQYQGGQSPYEELYERYYFDDPEMTVQVGYERDTCTYYGKGGGRTEGRYGPYVQENLIGACENGQPAIIR